MLHTPLHGVLLRGIENVCDDLESLGLAEEGTRVLISVQRAKGETPNAVTFKVAGTEADTDMMLNSAWEVARRAAEQKRLESDNDNYL